MTTFAQRRRANRSLSRPNKVADLLQSIADIGGVLGGLLGAFLLVRGIATDNGGTAVYGIVVAIYAVVHYGAFSWAVEMLKLADRMARALERK